MEDSAPMDLKERALYLAGQLLESCGGVAQNEGYLVATKILDSGQALKKFEAICKAQGGMKEPVLGRYKHIITSNQSGEIQSINNRLIARIAKLAGAPDNPGAGVDLHTPLKTLVKKGEPLFTIFAESPGELNYALHYFYTHQDVIVVGESPQ